ncbi:MAG: twin-arginine translocase TatA/TatE family subunit [Bacteroidota bacterium]|nr:MAG: twin-arginine translocase TatA/TatE family subunit [Bacteroidota bacterium]
MINLIAFGQLGATEIILILLIVLLLFGGRKIPELMKGLGKGMREFKKAKDGDDEPTYNSSNKLQKEE